MKILFYTFLFIVFSCTCKNFVFGASLEKQEPCLINMDDLDFYSIYGQYFKDLETDSGVTEREAATDDSSLSSDNHDIPTIEDSTKSGELAPLNYPQVSCAFNPVQCAMLSVILTSMPDFRSKEVFTVTLIEDLKNILVVQRFVWGPYFSFFQFSYDIAALRADCKNDQDLKFLQSVDFSKL